MFGEPPRSPYDLNFYVLGIPVRVHPMFWLVALLFGIGGNTEPGAMLIWVGVVFLSVLVHELGHAVVARRFGAQPWITLMGMGGLASFQSGRMNWKQHVLVLLAGPGAGFLLAAVVVTCVVLTGNSMSLFGIDFGPRDGGFIQNIRLAQLIFDLLVVNILWGIINLFPVYPLDGGQIARHVLVAFNPWQGIRWSLGLSVLAGGLLAVWGITTGNVFIAMFFGYMAFLSYQTLQGPGGMRGGW